MNDEIQVMEAAIRAKLIALSDDLGRELAKLLDSYGGMSDEIKASPFYKTLGERISSVEALFNTLVSTAQALPAPATETTQ
jgi:hypothetical protein